MNKEISTFYFFSKYFANLKVLGQSLCTIACCLIFLSGCATTEYHPIETTPPAHKPSVKKEGIYHKVIKGQTLFRIAKAYGISLDEIIEANGIPNAGAIEVNQLILIPGAKQVQDIPVVIAAPSVAGEKDALTASIDLNKDEFAWPLKGKVIAYFNDRKGDAVNKGVDIEAATGDTVKASREGKVILSDYVGSWGYVVIVDHGDGFMSVYAQHAKNLVKKGDMVVKGDALGLLAQIGHKTFLHFQIRKGQIAVNPLYYLP